MNDKKDKNYNELLNTGKYETFSTDDPITVAQLLKEFKVSERTCGVIVNGKKVELSYIIQPTDTLIIIPFISGGLSIK